MSLNTAAAVATARGLTAKFDDGVENAMPFYPEVSTVAPSMGADEQYGFLGSMPGTREWLGDRQFQTLRGADYTLKNREWENSVEIEKNDFDDDRIGMYDSVFADIGEEAAQHPDELLFQAIEAGETTACFDGQFFYDTDHAWGESGTNNNDLTADVTTPTTPTEAEFRTAYHAARAALLGFKRDNGKPYIRPTIRPLRRLILLVPTGLEEVANLAINKTLVSSGETNVVLDKPTIVTSASLTSQIKFHLLNVGQRLRPFVFQARRPISRGFSGFDDRKSKVVQFMADARYNVGYLAWWNAVLTTFV